MAAKVSFLTRPLDAAQLKAAPKLVAPADAVVERGGRTVVYVVEEGRARELAVATGPRLGDSIELTSGPVTGTRVVRHPSPRLGPGQSVKEKKS